MGKRHQLFVIAKINGQYRTLCVVHHQWLWGHRALRCCLDTLKILSDASNRIPLESELIAAAHKDDDFWVEDEKDSRYVRGMEYIPFPFVTTCLAIGSSFNLDGYHSHNPVRSFHMAYDKEYTDNGITIFDITDLRSVRYCFVDYDGMESKRKVPLMTPLSAEVYLTAYYKIKNTDKEVSLKAVLSGLNDFFMIDAAALKETWPTGEWLEPKPSDSQSTPSVNPQGDDEGGSKDTITKVVESTNMMTLREKSMNTLIDTLLAQSEEDPDLLAEAEMLPDFVPRLRQKLYEQAETLKPSANHLGLLCKALENEMELNISPFNNLPIQDLARIVTKLQGTFKILNLSNKPDLGDSDLNSIIDVCSESLGAVVILECPKITFDFLRFHLGGLDIYHSELFRRPLRENASEQLLLEFPSIDRISQIVLIGVSGKSLMKQMFYQTGHIDWSCLDQPKSSWWQSPFEILPIGIPLGASKAIHGLRRILQWLHLPRTNELRNGIACCLATTSDRNSASIGPLSTYMHYSEHMSPRPEHAMRNDKNYHNLRTNHWAMILIHEACDVWDQKDLDEEQDFPAAFNVAGAATQGPPTEEQISPAASNNAGATTQSPPPSNAKQFRALKQLRYALVRKLPDSESANKQYMVADVPGYLAHVMDGRGDDAAEEMKTLCAWWKDEMSKLKSLQVSYYDNDDIHEVLQMVYSSKAAAE